MKLLTKEILSKLPPLYATENVPTDEKVCVCKFFHPASRYTYFVIEFSPEEKLFFGYCVSPLGPDCDELGYTSLEELESVVVRGLKIERDLYFKPTKLAEILKEYPRN